MVFSETLRIKVDMSFILAILLAFITDKIASRLSFMCMSDTRSMSFFAGGEFFFGGICPCDTSLGIFLAISESVGASSKESRGSSYAATSVSSICASWTISSAFITESRLPVRAMERMLESARNSRESVARAAPGRSNAASMRRIAIASIRLFKDISSAKAGAIRRIAFARRSAFL